MDQVLDMSVVEELLSFSDDGDPELLLDLIQMFLDDGPSKVNAVTEGLAAGDFEKMERAAHSLKGSSGNLGARLLQDTCEQMLFATRHQKLEESRQLTAKLADRYAEAEVALRKAWEGCLRDGLVTPMARASRTRGCAASRSKMGARRSRRRARSSMCAHPARTRPPRGSSGIGFALGEHGIRTTALRGT